MKRITFVHISYEYVCVESNAYNDQHVLVKQWIQKRGPTFNNVEIKLVHSIFLYSVFTKQINISYKHIKFIREFVRLHPNNSLVVYPIIWWKCMFIISAICDVIFHTYVIVYM